MQSSKTCSCGSRARPQSSDDYALTPLLKLQDGGKPHGRPQFLQHDLDGNNYFSNVHRENDGSQELNRLRVEVDKLAANDYRMEMALRDTG